jgi:hypothetical protein
MLFTSELSDSISCQFNCNLLKHSRPSNGLLPCSTTYKFSISHCPFCSTVHAYNWFQHFQNRFSHKWPWHWRSNYSIFIYYRNYCLKKGQRQFFEIWLSGHNFVMYRFDSFVDKTALVTKQICEIIKIRHWPFLNFVIYLWKGFILGPNNKCD